MLFWQKMFMLMCVAEHIYEDTSFRVARNLLLWWNVKRSNKDVWSAISFLIIIYYCQTLINNATFNDTITMFSNHYGNWYLVIAKRIWHRWFEHINCSLLQCFDSILIHSCNNETSLLSIINVKNEMFKFYLSILKVCKEEWLSV